MNLKRKKELASRTLGVGKDRIVFVPSRIGDIKEAITKQDIRDLYKNKAIIVKEIKGRKKVRKKKRKGIGSIRKKIRRRKERYVVLTRKLRKYLSELKKQGEVSAEGIKEIRKKIKNKFFKSKSHLKEFVKEMKK